MDAKKKIIITGQKVHEIGYRPFLLGMAESLEIERFFADNTFINKKQTVYVLVDSSEEKVEAFVEIASSKFPEKSDVEKVDVEDYSGNVMRIESYYRYLSAMQLSKIATYGGIMLEKQDTTIQVLRNVSEELRSVHEDTTDMKSTLSRMEDKQDRLIEKQDTTVYILERVHGDTADMKSTLSRIEVDVKDTKFSLSSFIEEKYRKMEGEIAEIKSTLARMQA
jgi:acylphosphatase